MAANLSMVGTALGAAVVLYTSTLARADDLTFKVEPGVVIPTTAPQSEIYDIGGGQSFKALFGLTQYLAIGPTVSFLFLPASEPLLESGLAWGFGGGLRFKLPNHQLNAGATPWLDADLLYIRTGPLDRLGFDVAVGVSFPADKDKAFWVGPFVRYQQTFSGERMGYDTRDSKLVIAGLSVEFGSGGVKRQPLAARVEYVQVPAPAPPPVACPVCAAPEPVAAPAPPPPPPAPAPVVYKYVTITKDKLELKEKLFFHFNRAEIKPTSLSILDEVAVVLNDNPTINLRVEGHTDSAGKAAYNKKLSERRAQAVVAYLASKGIAKQRLSAKGFGPDAPLETNDSADGRERNRRVEFVITNDVSSK